MKFRAFLAAITFSFTSIFLPLLILEFSGGIKMSVGILTSMILIIYVGLHLSYLVFDGKKKILDITFWIFSYVWLGIAGLAQNAMSQYPWWGFYNDAAILATFFIILLGFLSYDIASFFASQRYKYPTKIDNRVFGFSYSKAILLGILASCISMYLIQKIGFSNFFQARKALYATFDSKMAGILQQNFAKVPVYTCLIICVYYVRTVTLTSAKRFSIILLILFLLVLNIIVSNPISSPRYWVGTIILSMLFVLVNWKSYTNFIIINFFILSFIILFPYTDAFRRTTDTTISVRLEEEAVLSNLTKNGDYDAYQMVMNTIRYAESSGITYGRQFMGAILFWVPRKFWNNKPVGSGQYVAEGLRYKYTTLSSPLWAEAYINFGTIGVVVVFLLYGVIKEKIQAIYSSISENKGGFSNYLAVLVPFLAAYQFFSLRGSLINAFAYSSVFFLFFFLHLKRSKEPEKENKKKSIALKRMSVS